MPASAASRARRAVGWLASALLVLLVSGSLTSPPVGGAQPPGPRVVLAALTGLWAPTGSMATRRDDHVAVRLADGRVLVSGGRFGASAELYDPATGTWSPAGRMTQYRSRFTATLLGSGTVLVAGGTDREPSAELYDPATATWSPTGSLLTARADHAAVLLPSGKVLVVGGELRPTQPFASAELYDPTSGTWTSAGAMSTARGLGHTATLLEDGRVLVAGGFGRQEFGGARRPLASAELYEPTTNTWSGTGSLGVARGLHAAALLPTGRVLVSGGGGSGACFTSAELYDPAAGTWSPTGSMAECHSVPAAQLSDGPMLMVGGIGGTDSALSERYDPATGTWSPAGTLVQARSGGHTLTRLATGEILLTGGRNASSSFFASAERYMVHPHRMFGAVLLAGEVDVRGEAGRGEP